MYVTLASTAFETFSATNGMEGSSRCSQLGQGKEERSGCYGPPKTRGDFRQVKSFLWRLARTLGKMLLLDLSPGLTKTTQGSCFRLIQVLGL